MIVHNLEFRVEEIEEQFKDKIRRKIVKILQDLGLEVYNSNIQTLIVED